MTALRNSEPAAEHYLPLNQDCELEIWNAACLLKRVYSKAMAVETLRRLADEMEGR